MNTLYDLFSQICRTATYLGDNETARIANKYCQDILLLGYLHTVNTSDMVKN